MSVFSWLNNWRADKDPVADTLDAIVDKEQMRKDGKVFSPKITYKPLRIAHKGSSVQCSYPEPLSIGEKKVVDWVHKTLTV